MTNSGVETCRQNIGRAGVGTLAAAMIACASQAASQEVITSHGISTFGNLKYSSDFSHLDYVNPDAPKGGEIAVWSQGTFDSMNPYTRKGRAGGLSSIFFESLLTGTADEISAAYCLICETMEYPEDRTWVVFNMRPEARFSDGTPLTAEDVKFSYEIFLEEGLISFRRILAQAVDAVEIESPYRIKFTFNTDEPTRDYPTLVGGLPIFSKAWFESTGAKLDESRLEPAVGSAPYVLGELEINRRLVYKRNEDYWGNHLPINQGRNNFDTIRIEYFGDAVAAFEGFKGGAYTFRNENVSRQWATAYDFPAIDNGWVVKKTFPDGDKASGQSFVFNLRRDKFADIRVREALGLMFNFEWSNQTLFYALYARIHSFWENSDRAATGLPSEAELRLLDPLKDQLLQEVFGEPAALAPSSGERQLDRQNLRRASELLDEAGWPIGDDGIRRNAEGTVLEVEFLEDSPTFARIINPYVENLQQLGVAATLSQVDPAQYTDRVRNHDFDMIVDSFGVGLEPGDGLKQYFGSQNIDGVFNSMGLANPAVDELIEHVIAAETEDELVTAVRALDRVLRSLKFWVPQWYRNFHTVAYYDIFEYPENLPPYALGEMDFWWFNQQKYDELVNAGAL